MEIKAANKEVSKEKYNTILNNWIQIDVNDELGILDSVRRLRFLLQVSYKRRGGQYFVIVPSRLQFTEAKNGILVSLYCSLIKPIIISFSIGVLAFAASLFITNNFLSSFILSILINATVFGLFVIRILVTARIYLSNLIEI